LLYRAKTIFSHTVSVARKGTPRKAGAGAYMTTMPHAALQYSGLISALSALSEGWGPHSPVHLYCFCHTPGCSSDHSCSTPATILETLGCVVHTTLDGRDTALQPATHVLRSDSAVVVSTDYSHRNSPSCDESISAKDVILTDVRTITRFSLQRVFFDARLSSRSKCLLPCGADLLLKLSPSPEESNWIIAGYWLSAWPQNTLLTRAGSAELSSEIVRGAVSYPILRCIPLGKEGWYTALDYKLTALQHLQHMWHYLSSGDGLSTPLWSPLKTLQGSAFVTVHRAGRVRACMGCWEDENESSNLAQVVHIAAQRVLHTKWNDLPSLQKVKPTDTISITLIEPMDFWKYRTHCQRSFGCKVPNSTTFLPSVWEQFDSTETFEKALAAKALAPESALWHVYSAVEWEWKL